MPMELVRPSLGFRRAADRLTSVAFYPLLAQSGHPNADLRPRAPVAAAMLVFEDAVVINAALTRGRSKRMLWQRAICSITMPFAPFSVRDCALVVFR
jgi:hypothetical protein